MTSDESPGRLDLLARLDDHGASLDEVLNAAHEDPDLLRRVEVIDQHPWLLHGTVRARSA